MSKSRRIAVLQITGDLVVDMFQAGPRRVEYSVVDHPLPADAKIVGAYFNAAHDRVELAFESEEFAELPEGGAAPVLIPPLIAVTNSAGEPMDPPRPGDCVCDKCEDF